MQLHPDYPLKNFNTFGFDVKTRYFAAPETSDEVLDIFSEPSLRALPRLILGGGSNVLFRGDFDGLIVRPQIQSIEIISENEESVYVRAGAGIEWDTFVAYCVTQNWSGIENLSLIPGTVGAAPVQNIGAYGVEAKDCIHQVEAIAIEQLRFLSFYNQDCEFGYRDSVFKREWKNNIVITHVTFRLRKQVQLSTHYADVEEELKKYPEVNLQTVREAIIAIRRRKLPDPAELGNAGSFFKNPVVPAALAERIKQHYPDVKTYPADNNIVKLPAGWLIEQCGWKGKRVGNVGVHANQALVLVNYGDGNGQEVLRLASAIQQSVREQFSVELEMEVNVV